MDLELPFQRNWLAVFNLGLDHTFGLAKTATVLQVTV